MGVIAAKTRAAPSKKKKEVQLFQTCYRTTTVWEEKQKLRLIVG